MGTAILARSPLWAWSIFLGSAFLVFWPVLHLGAFSDDHSALWNSAMHGMPWRNSFFRPLSDLSFRMVHLLGGTSPWGQRVFNVALHGTNAFLIYLLFSRLIASTGTRGAFGAWCAGLVFLVYPFHQESIVWLVGRESSLATLFTLLGLLTAGMQASIWPATLSSSVALLLGTLCYESTVLLPVLVIVMHVSGTGRLGPAARTVLIAQAITLVAYLTLRWSLSDPTGDSYFTSLISKGPVAIFSNPPKVLARLFLPPMPPHWMLWAAAALLLALGVVAWRISRITQNEPILRREIRTLILLLAVTCAVPVIGGVSTQTSESDRFLYQPSVILCLLAGLLLCLCGPRAVRWTLGGLLTVACLIGLRANHANWQAASERTKALIEELPEAPTGGRLFVHRLPDAYAGAFIFRNGFVEAVLLSGRDGRRYIPVPSHAPPRIIRFRGADLIRAEYDREIVWRDDLGRYVQGDP